MQPLKSPQRAFGKVALIIGAALAGVAAILVLISLIAGSRTFVLIFASVFGFQGVMWLIIGGGFWYYAKSVESKRERLKREGLCYEAEIVRIVPNGMFRVGASVSVHIECRYINHEDKSCLVKSGLFLTSYLTTPLLCDGPSDWGKYTAKVYVDRREPRDYYVDIQENGMQVDYDYR